MTRIAEMARHAAALSILAATVHGGLLSAPSAARADDILAEDVTGAAGLIPTDVDAADLPFEARQIAGPLDLPWGMAFLPDGRMLVTERPGKLRIIENGELLQAAVTGVPEVVSGGHSGLLDVVVAKDFERSRRIFLSYTAGTPQAATMRVASVRLDGMTLVDRKVIFDSRPAMPGLDQIGGRLAYGPDGNLYLTIGDRFQRERAQDLMDHAGSIVRFREDGSIPDDNPYVGRADALPEIFTTGHRNPQGLLVSRTDGRLWAVEHGPYGGDELNLIVPGANYGWPRVTFGIDYDGSVISDLTSTPGFVDPVHKWVPSLAPSSLTQYSGEPMPEDWQDSFLLGTLSGERLVKLQVRDGQVVSEQRMLRHQLGRIRNVAVGPDGFVYLLTDGRDAALYRLDPIEDEVARATGRRTRPRSAE